MTAITKYTDTATVRAIVGLTDKDVGDQSFVDMNLDDKLLSELTDWLPTHDTVYTDGTVGSPSETQKNNLRNLKLYSAYYCASHIDQFQLNIMASVGDGKNIMKRFEGVDFDELSAKLAAVAGTYKDRLDELINSAAISNPVFIGVVVPGYDPVTNT